eukprot:257792_1
MTQMKNYPYNVWGIILSSDKYSLNQYGWPYLNLLSEIEIPNKINISNSILEWHSFTTIEFADDNQKLYISGTAKQGVFVRSILGYIDINKQLQNASQSFNFNISSVNYFEHNNLTFNIGFSEGNTFNDIVFSSSTANWLAVTDNNLIIMDGNHLVTLKQIQLPLSANKISLNPRKNKDNSIKAAIAHSSYISFYNSKTNALDTISVPITTSTSIPYCGNNFVYPFPSEWVDMYQISLNGSTLCSSWSVYAGTYAKANPVHDNWIYADDGKWIVDLSTNSKCSIVRKGGNSFSSPWWYSYDGSLIFSWKGKVVRCTNGNDDMAVAGTFEDVYGETSYTYPVDGFVWITQMKHYPYYIFGLKSFSNKYYINQYDWPYLKLLKQTEIPNKFNLSNVIFEWDTFISMEVADSDQRLYISGIAKQGIILRPFISYVEIGKYVTNTTSSPTNVLTSPNYFKSDKLTWFVASYERGTFEDIVFNSITSQWISINENNLMILDANNFNLSNYVTLPLNAHKVSFQPQNNSVNSMKIAIAHSGYVSFYDYGTNNVSITTVNVPIITPESITYCSNGFVYAIDQKGAIYQVNLTTSTQCSTIGYSSNRYIKVNPVNDTWIYAVLSSNIQKLVVSGSTTMNQCSITKSYSPYYSNYIKWGAPFFFSYDGRFIFMTTGLVLHSSDDTTDMTIAGLFSDVYKNYSYPYYSRFVWITQMKKNPYYVYGLKTSGSSGKYTVNLYDWPYLNLIDELQIPAVFNLSNSLSTWETLTAVEVDDDNQQKLYISGNMKQGVLDKSIVGIVYVRNSSINATKTQLKPVISPTYYFKANKLSWSVAFYEGSINDIVFSPNTSQWIGIDNKNLIIMDAKNFNLTNYIKLPLNGNKVSLHPQNNAIDALKIAITHPTYVSFYDSSTNNISTVSVPLMMESDGSIVYAPNGFVYILEDSMYQVSLNGSVKCSSWAYGEYTKLNPIHNTWIYSDKEKWVVDGSKSSECSMVYKSYSGRDDKSVAHPFFFSYDGSFIFSWNGKVVRSTDSDKDFTLAGIFEDVYDQTGYHYPDNGFVWITQMKKNPYYVYGLKTSGSSGKYTVNLYDWPYLNLIDELQIPAVFNLSNSLSTWETLTAVEVDDDNQQKLYISGNMKQGVLDKSIVGIVYVRNSSINATKTQLKPVISPTYYFKANKLSWSVAFYEGSINDIVFSPNTSQWIGIDNKNLIIMDAKNFNLTNYIKLPLNGNKVSLHPQNNAIDALKIAITHPTYVSFYDSSTNNISTVSVPLMMESDGSIVYAPNGFVYILEDSMYQVSLNGSVKCSSWAYGEYTKLNPIHNTWIYSDKEKWVVDGSKSSECSMVYKSYSGRDDKSVAHPFFFSYDGSFIFSWNGKVVRSTDSDKDFTLAGIFEDVYDQTGYHYPDNGFVWITQMKHFPYYVFGLKSTPTNYTINIYDWPYLNLLNKIEIPNTFNVNNSVFEWDSFTALEFAENNDQILYISGIAKHVQGLILKSVFGQIDISNYSTNETVIPPPDNVISPVNHVNQTDLTWHIASYEQGTFEDIVFSSTTSQWVGLDNNNLIVVNGSDIHLSNYIRLPLNGHKVSIQPHNKRSLKVAVAHSNYISFYDSNTNKVQTVNVPITKSTSIPYCSNGFVYSFPEEDQWVDIYQITSNTSILCSSWSA